MSGPLKEERASAARALHDMVKENDPADSPDLLYEIRNIGLRLFAVPRDVSADYHLRWDGAEWQLEEGPVATGASHWWRACRIWARRYGLNLPITCPEAALQAWGDGMSSSFYVSDHLEADMGFPEDERVVPTLAQKTAPGPICPQHREPIRENHGCPVVGCG